MTRILRFRFPRLRTCLGFIDLQTAVEVITIFTLINKVSGFYGILSLFTGADMTALQMSMYIWSIFGTIVCLWALNCIRHENPMELVAYAYFFVIDFLINILYTFIFAAIWYLIVSNPNTSPPLENLKSAVGGVDPLLDDVTKVNIIATPAPNPLRGQDASLLAETGSAGQEAPGGFWYSTVSIGFFWLIKIYCILIVFSYARSLIVRAKIQAGTVSTGSNSWRGKIERRMIAGDYWREDEDDYKQNGNGVVVTST